MQDSRGTLADDGAGPVEMLGVLENFGLAHQIAVISSISGQHYTFLLSVVYV